MSFSPSYNANNQITSVGGQSYSYDADGNLLGTGTGTGTNKYGYNGFEELNSDQPSGGSTVGINYDALGRAATTNVTGGAYTEFVYAPDGSKLALMNGQTLYKARLALPGGGMAVYDPTGLIRYWHSDWQGSMRLVSSPSSPTYYWSGAYAPYGETYASASNPFVVDFASLVGDTSGELNDAMFRKYSPAEGRWMSPDPAGLGAVDLTNPQSLNRYAYVMNNPTTLTDPSGLIGEPAGCSPDSQVRGAHPEDSSVGDSNCVCIWDPWLSALCGGGGGGPPAGGGGGGGVPVGGGGGGMPTAGSGGTGGGVTASGSPPFNEKPPVNLNGQLSPAQLLWPDSWGQLPCEFGPCSGLGPDGFVTGTQAAGVGVAALGTVKE